MVMSNLHRYHIKESHSIMCMEALNSLHAVFMLHCTFLLCTMPFLIWKHRIGSVQKIPTVARSLMNQIQIILLQVSLCVCNSRNIMQCIGGSRGGAASVCPPPPTGSISFIFTYVFAEKCTSRRLAPPNGKSWIHHCSVKNHTGLSKDLSTKPISTINQSFPYIV